MQPYFFPYVGYFQLMNLVDKVVFLDDVNFINGGWIHRNRINNQGQPMYVSVPLVGKSQNRKINEIEVAANDDWKKNLFKILLQTYAQAPFRDETLRLIDKILAMPAKTIADLNIASIVESLKACDIQIEFVRASELPPTPGIKGSARILAICQLEGANAYLNPPGGKELYSNSMFQEAGIELNFLRPEIVTYAHTQAWLPGLSIIDLLMYVPRARLRDMCGAGILEGAS